ncbi:MAG: DeoR/GlpR family DNA-binding transcription regulator [Verrucomicrobiota bacterium]
MKVATSVILARRKSLAELLENRYLPLAEVCSRFGISAATARRDLRALQRERKITRTYGGALGTFDATFASFADRRAVDHEVKARLAQKARRFLRPDITCFFDGGTTVFALAEALHHQPVPGLRAVTNSLPVAEMLGRAKMEVYLLGGRFLQRQSLLLGPEARRSARHWRFDLVFLGAEGLSRAGVWASEPEVAAFQKVILAQATRVIVCAHSVKLGRETGVFLASWSPKLELVTDIPAVRRARHGLPA